MLAIEHGQIPEADSHQILQVAKSIVNDQNFHSGLGRHEGVVGRDGVRYSKYGLGGSILMAVPYALAQPFATALPSHTKQIEEAAVSLLMPLTAVLLVFVLYRLGLRLGASEGAALLVALGAVFGTYALPYVQEFYADPITALFLAAAVLAAVERRPAWAGAALGAAMLVRPQYAVLAPLLVAYLVLADGWRAALRSLPTLGAGLALVLAYDYVRFGSVTQTGYSGNEGFTFPFFKGAVKLLFNKDKSLLLFAPATLLIPAAFVDGWRSRRLVTVLLSLIFVAAFVMSATWFSWEAGWSWGPRLLLPGVLPLLAILAPWASRSRTRMRLLGAMFALGLLVSVSTVVVSTEAQQLQHPAPTPGPEVVRQVKLVPATIRRTIEHAAHSSGRALGQHRSYVNTWQVGVLRAEGWSGFAVAALITLCLLGGALVGALALRSALQRKTIALEDPTLAVAATTA